MATNVKGLDIGVAEAQREFFATRQALIEALANALIDPAAGADAMISMADEFGPVHVAEVCRTDASHFGAPITKPADVPDLALLLENAIDAHDGLDMALRDRDDRTVGTETGRQSHAHILGQMFLVDQAGQELRSVEDPNERYEIPGASADQALDQQAARRRDADRLNRLNTRAPDRDR